MEKGGLKKVGMKILRLFQISNLKSTTWSTPEPVAADSLHTSKDNFCRVNFFDTFFTPPFFTTRSYATLFSVPHLFFCHTFLFAIFFYGAHFFLSHTFLFTIFFYGAHFFLCHLFFHATLFLTPNIFHPHLFIAKTYFPPEIFQRNLFQMPLLLNTWISESSENTQ